MKKNVFLFGSISGLFITIMMLYSVWQCYNNPNFESNMVLGYAGMLLAFALVFVGIKNYRDKQNEGYITFGKAFKVGLYITLISSSIYTVVWLVDYYVFIPDFLEKYVAHVLKEARQSGATPQELEQQTAQLASYGELYKNPLMVVILTLAEVFPIGLVITLISALILKRKPKTNTAVN